MHAKVKRRYKLCLHCYVPKRDMINQSKSFAIDIWQKLTRKRQLSIT